MEESRRVNLELDPDGCLTDAEMIEGWHFCPDWDFLLIGPGMHEFESCCLCEIRGESR